MNYTIRVNKDEVLEILKINEKGYSLYELEMCLNSLMLSENEIKKLKIDIGKDIREAQLMYYNWWDKIIKKYQLNINDRNNYTLDFETGEVNLIKN